MNSKYIVFILSIMLMGCEAPLQLDDVLIEQQATTHRSDRLQRITSNGDVNVVVGSFGVILTSMKDGGWTRQQIASQPSFIDVTHCPDKSFVALTLEGSIWTSSDNGITWAEASLQSEETPQALTCAPDGKIWVVGSFSTFLSSNNHGQTWQSMSLDEDMILSYIKFFDDKNAIATAEFGSLLETNDGGETWFAKNPMPNEFYPIASLFTSVNEGRVVGLSGKILFTNNGGDTWLVEKSGTKAPLYGLSKSQHKMYATGALGTFLVKNLDQENSPWQSIHQNTRSYLRGALAFDDHVIIVGGKGFLKNASLVKSEKAND